MDRGPNQPTTPERQTTNVGPRPSRNFRLVNTTQAEEDAYDYVKYRNVKFTSVFGSVAHIVKGALGGGILSGHVSFMKAGVAMAIPLTLLFGVYMSFCLYLLVHSAQILYRRTKIPSMSYSDVGEAAFMMFPNRKVARFSKPFRYTIDAVIGLDLFGACACYQIMIAKQIKQLVEDTHETSFEGSMPGYPGLRVYLAIMIPLIICICLIRHLKWLAPFSVAANIVVAISIILAVYYAFVYNPRFENLVLVTSAYGTFEFIGITVFSMSCAGVVIAIENNMREPNKFAYALSIGMSLIVFCTLLQGFFGYSSFLEKSVPPITLNFPMGIMPKILKGLIAVMIYVTHALNFWVPFNLCFYYIKRKHNEQKVVFWELVYRAIFVTIIGIVAIVFPDINALMGFLGCFCLSNIAFIWPNVINLLVIWERPGLGHLKWRLWRSLTLIGIGIFIFICGTLVSIMELVSVFIKINVNANPDED